MPTLNGTSADGRLQQGCEGVELQLPQAPQASACKDTSKKRSADASRLGILLLATGPKRSIGHLLGGEKNLVAILTVPPGGPRRWNPVDLRPGGLSGVAFGR